MISVYAFALACAITEHKDGSWDFKDKEKCASTFQKVVDEGSPLSKTDQLKIYAEYLEKDRVKLCSDHKELIAIPDDKIASMDFNAKLLTIRAKVFVKKEPLLSKQVGANYMLYLALTHNLAIKTVCNGE